MLDLFLMEEFIIPEHKEGKYNAHKKEMPIPIQ